MNIYTLLEFKNHEYKTVISSYKDKKQAIDQVAIFAKQNGLPLPIPKIYYDGYTSVYNFGAGNWYEIEQNELI